MPGDETKKRATGKKEPVARRGERETGEKDFWWIQWEREGKQFFALTRL